jgi:glycosyltransferase involved in cell wall biosynthesis
MVLVTVIMGSYNHERYVAEAIESVLGQTFRDLELVIVDDGSTDSSRKIIEQYHARDPRVRAFFHEKNMGIARTANDCLKEAKGRYLSFIGSDDVWYPHKLERQLDLMRCNEDKILWSDGQIIDSYGVLTGQVVTQVMGSPPKKSGNLFQELLAEDFIFGQSTLLKTEYAQEIAFNEEFRYVNDHLFFIDLARKHDFLFIPEPLAKYRVHGQNTTSKNPDLWYKERIALRNTLLQTYKDEISATSMADIYYKMGHAYAGLGEKDLAKHFYFRALRVEPFRAHSLLYFILALTNGEGFAGRTMESYYKRLLLFLSNFSVYA